MRQGQVAANLAGGAGTAFWGYSDRASLRVTALAGPLSYQNDPWASVDLTLGGRPEWQVSMSGTGNTSLTDAFSRAPPTLRLASLQSSVTVEDPFGHVSTLTVASAPRGTLELLAGTDVHLAVTTLRLDDVGPDFVRGPLDPWSTHGDQLSLAGDLPDATTNFQHGFTPIHAGDPQPVRIDAGGSVCAQRSGACTLDTRSQPTIVITPKPLEVIAGTDVMGGIFQPQNDGPNDLTVLQAGRDLYETGLQITGNGSALLQAGRDLVLNQYGATSQRGGGILGLGDRTILNGTKLNLALPAAKGADIHLLAGAANPVDYDAFAAAYLDPDNRQHVVQTYLPELADYMQGLGYGGLSNAALVAAFRALPLARREIFLDGIYFNELKQTGIDYNDLGGPRYQSYQRGFRAVSLLFPGNPATASPGDVILNAKSLETQADGDITVLAPYGHVAVGTDVVPQGVDPASGGIVTRRGGNIRIMSDGNIDLFTSRIFTLQGGDITLWSSDGSITAGAGAKTSVFQKPLVYDMDNEGVITLDAFGLQTGAGIGVLDALLGTATLRRSRLDLIAPRGEVNAGDAGIRVVGDINIAAQVVVGAENIQVSGASAGVPKVEAPNLGALTSATAVGQAAASEGAAPALQPKSTLAELPSIITVEVVGYETTETPSDPGADKKRKPAGP
jgi:hypothetical protein